MPGINTNKGHGLFQVQSLLNLNSILRDSNTVAWYSADDLSTITKNGSNIVSRVNDKLNSGNDLVSGGCGWSESDGFTFNGIDQFLKSAAIANLVQPTTIYIFIKNVTATAGARIIDGFSNGLGLIYSGSDNSGELMYAGKTATIGYRWYTSTWGLLRIIFNGANSQFKTNRNNPDEIALIDTGTNNMGGITLGYYSNINSNFGNINFKEAIFRKGVDSVLKQRIIYDYLKNKYAKTYLVMGGSNTGQQPQWAELMAEGWVGGEVPLIINRALVGAKIMDDATVANSMISQINASIAANDNPDVALMPFGANDTENAEIGNVFKANLLVLRATFPNVKIYVIEEFENRLGTNARTYNMALIKTAIETVSNCYWIDTDGWINMTTDLVDDVHISVTGHPKVARKMLDILCPASIPAYPTVLNDGNTAMWLKSEDTANITKDGSDLVSRWDDFLESGQGLIQATGIKQPIWSVDGITFDGINDSMKTSGLNLNQPCTYYMVIKELGWTDLSRICEGNTDLVGNFRQYTTSPNLRIYSGAGINPTVSPAIGTKFIARITWNGATSNIKIGSNDEQTGNLGANNPVEFTLAGNWSQENYFSNILVNEVIIRRIADSGVDNTAIWDYLAAKYGL